ncbi:hypothetical protein H7X68_00405 [Candidatus Saccharibacteria bacterium]|nr:hypothetical protein [Candidatus Saccharibacteria bacterium]
MGNVSKIGLVLAAAMLPLCFVAIQKVFEKQQLRYLLLWIACLNVSLIHPFTLTVNLLVSGGYLLYMANYNKSYIAKNIPKLLLVGLIGLLLNAYFLLPLASIGSVSKDVLSSNVASVPTDYTLLIAVANTGDIFTGLSLAKGVLKDYEFYDDSTQILYFLGIFSFYVILFGVYVRVEKRLSISDRKYFAWSLAAFLVLLLLAAVNYLFVKDLIRLIVGLPGGWIFRSPLKWQLYIPFTLATILAIALVYIPKDSRKLALYSMLAVSFLCMNAFISTDIYSKLLTPREISQFGALQQMNLDQKNLLIINDESCFSFASSNPGVMTELNQILTSKNVQVKQLSIDVAETVNLSSYDYVLGCQTTAEETLQGYDFNPRTTFADNAFQLYANTKPKAYVYANQKVFALEKPQQVGNKYQLVTKTLNSEFDFIDIPAHSSPTTFGLQAVYENVTFGDMNGSSIKATLRPPPNSGAQTLYLKNTDNLNYNLSNSRLSLTPEDKADHQTLGSNGGTKVIELPHTDKLSINYDDSRYDAVNMLSNPSLEQGLWQQQVSDCYAYGKNAKISMHTNKDDKTNGAQSLQLEAQNHVACTGPSSITVQANQNYLLSFDYKTFHGRFAAYYVSFDDEAGTSFFKRLDDTTGDWATITKNIMVPSGAHNLKLLMYAYPDSSGINTGLARYDNFQLAATPNVQNHFYLLSAPKQVLQQPKKVSYSVTDPTKTTIRVEGARTPFYLETKESYNPRWSLGLDGGERVEEANHVKINNYMNGWLIDPSELCQSSCTKNNDGSYDLTLVMEFAPQRWLYIGTTISTLTLVTTVGYLMYDRSRSRAPKKHVVSRSQ